MKSRILIAVTFLLLLSAAFGLGLLFQVRHHEGESAGTGGVPGAAPLSEANDVGGLIEPRGPAGDPQTAQGDPRTAQGDPRTVQGDPAAAVARTRTPVRRNNGATPAMAPSRERIRLTPPPAPPPPPEYEMQPPTQLTDTAQALVGKSWQAESGELVTLGDHGALTVGNDDTGSWKLDGDSVVLDGPLGRKVLPLDEVSSK